MGVALLLGSNGPLTLKASTRWSILRAAALGLLLGVLWLTVVLYFVGQAGRAEQARFTMDRVKQLELEARRSEKNFLLRSLFDPQFYATGTSPYLKFHALAVTALRAEVLRLGRLLPEGEQPEIENLGRRVDDYAAAFNQLVDVHRRQGFAEYGLAGEWERASSQLQQTFHQNGDLLSAKLLLQVRHAEKKYIWRGDADCLEVHAESVGLLRAHMKARPARARLLSLLDAYQRAFGEYLENEKIIGRTRFEGLQGEYQRAIDSVEPAVEKLERRAIATHEQATWRQTTAIVIASILMAVLLGAGLLYARAAHAGQRQLRAVNERLEGEIAERWRAEKELQEAHDQLDRRVKERTAQVAQVNQALELELAERQKLEAQLMQSLKMEAVGRLAGGIAHDFNNLLMIISGHTELLLENTNLPQSGMKSATRIQEASQRAAALTKQLLAFSRKQVLQARVVDLNAVVGEIEHMLRRLIGEHIELGSELALDLGCVKADPGQIEQVIMNLAVNARDAMPRGGKLLVRTVNFDVEQAYARRNPGMRPGEYVLLEVADTGIGMDAETQLHIFEPFFTTKEKGRGTGLGLATTYGIVKQSNGYIAVESFPGMGTTFRIFLPRVEASVETNRVPSPASELPRGSETILLVEDEEPLRLLAREFLEKSGYRVLDAPNGPDALAISRNYHGPIHLLLTDVIMPGMSGPDLAAKLKVLRPEALVLFASGYTDDELADHGFTDAGTAFLSKPFTRGAVSRKVRDLLDRVVVPR